MKLINKNILTITDGSQGMISQVEGLSHHLSNKVQNYKTDVLFPWSKLQPGFLPVYKWIFKKKFDFKNRPDIIISCGRKSVYLSLLLKRIYKKQIISIHIQNPKTDIKNFDFIISPNHDGILGPNVINSIGAIHHFKKENIEQYKIADKNLSNLNNLVSIIIGGQNRHYKFDISIVKDLIQKILILKDKYKKYNFLIISSRRTDQKTINLLNEKLGKENYVWNKKTENPYKFALKKSKYFILTSDSTSMISECAFTGKPLYIYHLPFKRNSQRIIRFHREFENLKITRQFEDNLEKWDYEILDEAKRIAGILLPRILNK